MYFLQSAHGKSRLLAVALALLGGCSVYRSPGEPNASMLDSLKQGAERGPAGGSWPADPLRLEAALTGELRVLDAEETESGLSGPLHLTLDSAVLGRQLEAKWKRAPDDLEVINNSPRKEIAAYELQKLVLDPPDFVVPTTTIACLGPDALPDERLEPQSVVPARCAVGTLQAWLADVEVPEHKLDVERFWLDPVYAYHLANLNLVMILMDHSDSHDGNILHATDPSSPRVFSVDNGIAFGSWFRNPFVRDWNLVRVPALRSETIDRLRSLTREDLDRLGVVAQLDCSTGDTCRAAERGRNLAPSEGVRVAGSVVQLGLTRDEINGIWRRRGRLLRAVDRGRVAVF